jgi:hypothetical protein
MGQVYSIYYPTAGTHEIETWLSNVIRTNWVLALSLWYHRNGVVHGTDTREVERKLITKLHKEVCLEYKLYESDPFIISRSQSFLFESRTLHQSLQQDRDSIQCWLTDVREAQEVQEEARVRAAEAAKQFFVPRSKQPGSTTIREESSGGTTCIYDMSGDDSITTVTNASLAEESISDSDDVRSLDGTFGTAFSP